MTNKKEGTLYVGITDNLLRRTIEHKRCLVKGFTKKYKLDKLVWFEQTVDSKGKANQKVYRQYKVNVIEEKNPEWKDLFYSIGGSNEMLKLEFVYGNV